MQTHFTRPALSPGLFNRVLESQAIVIRQEENKKEEIKLSLFEDDMVLYKESPKEATKNLFNEFSKTAGYKPNKQKSIAFLYTNNKVSEKLRKPFTTAPKRIKYLGVNLTKEVRDLYSEN